MTAAANGHESRAPRIMFIVPSDYDDLERKGVSGMIGERDEGGFFEAVISVHPFARRTRTISIDPTHMLLEFGFTRLRRLPGPLRLVTAPVHMIRTIVRLRRIIRAHGVDIVRATDPFLSGTVAWLATLGMRRIPLCISIHADHAKRHQLDRVRGAPTLLGSRSLAERVERFVLRRADWILPIRRSLADRVVESAAVPLSRVLDFPHVVEDDVFGEPAGWLTFEDLGVPADAELVVFAGRLSRENYVDDVVELARRLGEERPNLCVLLCGDGPERERLEEVRRNSPVLARCLAISGFVPRERVLDARRRAAVNLCPMGGFSLIEACASGRPTVAYDVEWHAELIIDGVTGSLVPEADVDRLTSAVRDLLDDPETAKRLGGAARDRAWARHSSAQAQKIRWRSYERILQSRSDKAIEDSSSPADEVRRNNPWYVDDQISEQLGNPGTRAVVERRWRIFDEQLGRKLRCTDGLVRVLDAGCGDGINLRWLLSGNESRFEQRLVVHGVDYNLLRVHRAGNGDSRVAAGSVLALPYADGAFDVVLCNHVIEHVREHRSLVAELRRVLTPGGLLLLGTPNEGCLMARLRNGVVQRSIKRTTDHVNFYTRSRLVSLVEGAGFTVDSVEAAWFWIPHARAQSALMRAAPGRRVLWALGRVVPSQTTDLVVVAMADWNRRPSSSEVFVANDLSSCEHV